jgi:L-2-hydroxyglutarate oxidase LhgO
VPEIGGLGVHATIDLHGQVRFGPDVEWVKTSSGNDDDAKAWEHDAVPDFDYTVDPSRADAFYAKVRKYWPGLKDGALQPDYAGVRPKLQVRVRGHATFFTAFR